MDFNNIIISILNTTINSFDFTFCIVVNIVIYGIIKLFDEYNGDKKVTTWNKRIITLIVIIILGSIYASFDNANYKLILNSAILAPVSYSWIFQPILNKLGIGYKK